jgi:hypothetical protein
MISLGFTVAEKRVALLMSDDIISRGDEQSGRPPGPPEKATPTMTTATHTPQRGAAVIIDNRDQTRETVRALGSTVHCAAAAAFTRASSECRERNAREGWERFVPVR